MAVDIGNCGDVVGSFSARREAIVLDADENTFLDMFLVLVDMGEEVFIAVELLLHTVAEVEIDDLAEVELGHIINDMAGSFSKRRGRNG